MPEGTGGALALGSLAGPGLSQAAPTGSQGAVVTHGQNAHPEGSADESGAAALFRLLEHGCHMPGDSMDTEIERFRDLTIAVPGSSLAEHIDLTSCQMLA
jgi:hypothetical protein